MNGDVVYSGSVLSFDRRKRREALDAKDRVEREIARRGVFGITDRAGRWFRLEFRVYAALLHWQPPEGGTPNIGINAARLLHMPMRAIDLI